MADYRQLHSRMWSSDTWFSSLKPDMKLLFIYLFSNERASVCGLYEIPIRIMSFETGLDRSQVESALGVFSKADKVKYDFETGVVWIRNMLKYQSSSSPKLQARIKADIKAVHNCNLKEEYLEWYGKYTDTIGYRSGIDTLLSVSVSDSDSVSFERGGMGEKTLSPADHYNLDLFTSRFGKFNSQAEGERWQALVLKHGRPKVLEILEWAEKKEINLTGRDVLLDSLETAAEKWNGHRTKKQNEGFSQKLEEA